MLRRLLCTAVLACAPLAAAAQWPEKPVRIVVPYVTGAMGDIVSRFLAEEVRPKLGQVVLVDNRPGAGGNIGTAAVAQAAPDGYTVLVAANSNVAINQFLYRDMGFDPLEALVPVTILVDVPSVIFLSGKVPVRTFPAFVEYARANKGKLNYGSPAAGSSLHIAAALISKTRDLGMTHIAYKGASQVITALLADEVQLYMGGAGLGAQHVAAGRLHAVAVSSPQRLESYPDIPTFAEVGLSDIKVNVWWTVAVPRGTSPDVVQKLHAVLHQTLASSTTQERFRKLGITPVGITPAETARRWREDADYWRKAVVDMGVRVD